MFGSLGKSTPSKAQRAQQLRKKREATSGKTSNTVSKRKIGVSKKSTGGGQSGGGGDDEVMVVSGVFTILCAFFIVALGAAIATLCFALFSPDCVQGLFSFGESPQIGTNSVADSKSVNRLRRMEAIEPELPLVHIKQATEATSKVSMTKPGVFPPKCPSRDLKKLSQQLPAAGCEANQKKPWRRLACSFSMATTCHDSIWFKEYYAKNPFDSSVVPTSIHVGCNKGYQAAEFLRLATRDAAVYNWEKLQKAHQKSKYEVKDGLLKSSVCPIRSDDWESISVPAHGNGDARAFCIEPFPSTFKLLEESMKSLKPPNAFMKLSQVVIADIKADVDIPDTDVAGEDGTGLNSWKQKCKKGSDEKCTNVPITTLDDWVSEQPGLGPEDPIHFLSLGLEGADPRALAGSAKTLPRVQYLEFQYHWLGDWDTHNLQETLESLKTYGMVCYFAGGKNLWRVTDCWQDHYALKFFSNVACANVNKAPGLVQAMEERFKKTLTMELKFGG